MTHPFKQYLHKTLKQQYGILQTLRVAMHPAKTVIGKVKKGFDFPGFHLTPTEVTVSEAALSRHEHKVARLYEQDAAKKRIRAYRLRWLVWVTVMASSTALADQTQYANCIQSGIGYFSYYDRGWKRAGSTSASVLKCIVGRPQIALPIGSALPTQPIEDYTCTKDVTPSDGVGTAYHLFRSSNRAGGEYCLYALVSNGSRWISRHRLTSPSTPQNIPIFGPFGLLAAFLSLLWFARRRKSR